MNSQSTQVVGLLSLGITVIGLVGIGVLVKLGLLDSSFADTAAGALLGGGAVTPVAHALGKGPTEPIPPAPPVVEPPMIQ